MSKTTDTERADVLGLLDRDKPLKDHDDIVLFEHRIGTFLAV